MVDVRGVTAQEMRRQVLLEEGVFPGVATADAAHFGHVLAGPRER